LLQPLVGLYHDKRPMKYSLSIGMGFTFVGLLVLAYATTYPALLLAAALVGMGSSVFHPEASRIARLASGGRYGVAQTVFQVGGNFGTSLGPLGAALIIVQQGQSSIAWFSLAALLAMLILFAVGTWYGKHHIGPLKRRMPQAPESLVSPNRVVWSLIVLALLVLSKYIYLVSFTSYYTFYLIERFHLTTQQSQIQLFVFLFAIAAGTLVGGPIGDRIGRKKVIWASILGIAPFTISLPYAGL
jgi:FSR family fosmidomycin resistance protein-like MFS transporter